MYDALGNASEDVAYTLTEANNTYTLTVTANADWINTEGRSFPITIDPTYVVSTESVDDTYIDSDTPDTARGSNSMLWVRANRTTYIKTPTPSIPEYAELDWAALTAFYYFFDYITSGSVGVTAHRIISPWEESSLTWNLASNMSGDFGLSSSALDGQVTYGSIGATANNPEQIDFVITSAVQGWLDGTYSNYGIGLKYVVNSSKSVVFKSSEASYTYRPRITYQYGTNVYRYTNYYDSSLSSANVNNITTAVNLADTAYRTQFGVRIYTNGAPTYKGTLADACSLDSDDMCSSVCTVHHKELKRISDQLFSEVESDQKRIVYWTDRASGAYCYHDKYGNCYSFDLLMRGVCLAVVYDSRPVIHFMNLLPDNGGTAKDLACMGINLIHETAHTFGLNDRYEGYSHNADGYQCVMECYIDSDSIATDFYNDIRDGKADAFCTGCASDLLDLIFE